MSSLQNENLGQDQLAHIVKKVWSLVDALPQRDQIAMSDARQWIGDVVHAHGEAAIWHAIRLNGFGGSEIGVLVRNMQGERADHQASAHDIVEGKLMRRAPLESSAHMTRGHENEEPHSKRFWSKYGAQRDLTAYESLKNAQGSRQWMRYSPDDMVLMPLRPVINDDGEMITVATPGEMHRWLIDYKAPSKVEEGDEIAFQYACQLTQGAILCAENDVPIEGMMLSQFDWANWALKDDVVPWNEDMGLSVIQAGDMYWDCVLRGEVPPYIRKRNVEGLDEYVRQYLVAAQSYAALAALSDAAKNRADEIRQLMMQPLNGMRLGNDKITFGEGRPVLTVSAQKLLDRELAVKLFDEQQLSACEGKKAVYDAEAMAAYLKANGTDIKQFRKYDLDATKVYEMAAELGLDPDAIVAERVVMSAAKEIKGQMVTYIDEHYPLESIHEAVHAAPVDAVMDDVIQAATAVDTVDSGEGVSLAQLLQAEGSDVDVVASDLSDSPSG